MSNTTTDSIKDVWAPLRSSRTALLTTFRRNGQGVGTPITILIEGEKIYFTTWTTTGKVKRMTHTPRVTLASCTQRGKVTGSTVEGTARRLSESESNYVRQHIIKKSFMGELWRLIYRLRKLEPVMFEITSIPVENPTEATPQ
ncbi:PPOX class F420-dependent oxidoreductase [Dictyobacter kobayashii]|uniref:PPOX class F420-dependent oxidoreductase n=1 Tax=Dictyobacter kobayashii TaxID=2014872 RepID=A0A402AQA0_9CHLR|nr:PPOX class F420-dependent oxidoreductase [Dictyobacter kobayashii]GCE21224.1 PPOX class F420-dependent oxidoreductase [Dictyobacter kobayashii]